MTDEAGRPAVLRRRREWNCPVEIPSQTWADLEKPLSFSSTWFCAEGSNCNPTGSLRGCTTRLQLPGASDCYVCGCVSDTFFRDLTRVRECNRRDGWN